jgi:16S rRNA (cytosine1402-N4)-methyltransferase
MDQTRPSSQRPEGYHIPVMPAEVVELFSTVPSGLIVDATFGGGGHTRRLRTARPDLPVLALDRDRDVMTQVPDDPQVRLRIANFADLDRILSEETSAGGQGREHNGSEGRHLVAGVLFDLGVSSHQLDEAARGFSYRVKGPLDMRMGHDAEGSAADMVNEWSARELAAAFRRYGEEQFAARIADAIVAARPFEDTEHLAAVVAAAVPAPARRRRHPARKVFQAIRIAVNEELAALAAGLDAALRWVRPNGRVVVIAYHSLEDRIVKRAFASATHGCECPPDLPVCACGRVAEFRSLARKAWRPGEEELADNPRARSARLRAVERIAA